MTEDFPYCCNGGGIAFRAGDKKNKSGAWPVCGVLRRNAVVAPLLAPRLCSDIETGITPQLHKGRGTPKAD